MKRYMTAILVLNLLAWFVVWYTSPIHSGTVTLKTQQNGVYYIYATDQFGRQQGVRVSKNAWEAARAGDLFSQQCVCIVRPK